MSDTSMINMFVCLFVRLIVRLAVRLFFFFFGVKLDLIIYGVLVCCLLFDRFQILMTGKVLFRFR